MRVTSFLIADQLGVSGFHSGPPAPRNQMKHNHIIVLKPLIPLWSDLSLSQILELTLLMASYMNHWNPSLPSASHQPLGHWDVDSRHFPAMNYTTKGPTLLWIVQEQQRLFNYREASWQLLPLVRVGLHVRVLHFYRTGTRRLFFQLFFLMQI